MKRNSAKLRIALAQVGFLTTALLFATSIGLVPDRYGARVEGRARLCEALAVNSSLLATEGRLDQLETGLETILRHNSEILSAAVRQRNGQLIVDVGDHEQRWKQSPGADTNIYVPIWADNNRWGTLEVRFQALRPAGLLGFLLAPELALIAFLVLTSFVFFLFYLGRMLRHLDPAKVVPSRVRSALDSLAEGLIIVDRSERIVLANRAFAEKVGKAPEELQGQRASDCRWVRCNDEASDAPYPWTRALEEKTTQTGAMLSLQNGRIWNFIVNSAPVLSDGDEVRGALTSFEDVTALEEKKTQLEKSRETAEEANRAKSDFLARMSHDIRTPMNAILGFTEALRTGLVKDEAQRLEHLNTIHTSGKHLLELINDILDLSKIEAGHMEVELIRVSPHRLIHDVASVLSAPAREKGIDFEYGSVGGLPETITTDPGRLRQILMNLAGNAIKFTETGGVRIMARLLPQRRDSVLVIEVSDTGVGIAAEKVDQVFKPFAQADTSVTREFGGTGLGLAISLHFAEALHGHLSVESEAGQGSVLTLEIPTGSLEGVPLLEFAEVDVSADEVGDSEGLLELPPSRVLVVDDGATNRELATLLLEEAGAEVETAENGQDAVDKVLQNGYDVILMDMQMPVMDGYTATRVLRERGVVTPVIALTAHAMREEEAKCRDAGCSGFLSKPFEFDDLIGAVAHALEESAVERAG